jgi:hypothetical protein
VIWVIDASDRRHFGDARYQFDILKDSLAMAIDAPFLILANKIDWPYAAKAGEVISALSLGELQNPWVSLFRRICTVRLYSLVACTHWWQRCQPCSMQNGFGVYEGMKWLADALSENLLNKSHPAVNMELDLALAQAFAFTDVHKPGHDAIRMPGQFPGGRVAEL